MEGRKAASANRDGGAARRDHQHPAAAARGDVFIVQVDADHCVRSKPLRLLLHLAQGNLLGFAQGLFVRAAAPADDVPDTGEKVAEDVCAQNSLAADEAVVLAYLLAAENGGGGDIMMGLLLGGRYVYTLKANRAAWMRGVRVLLSANASGESHS